MRELSDDESGAETGSDNDAERDEQAICDPKDAEKPWLKEFNGYLRDIEDLGSQSIVQWWGVSTILTSVVMAINTALQLNVTHYPVWASLALDYLPIMASSVSSERAFSLAGITISKRQNRLGPDLIEALQFLKCWFRRDLIFCEDPTIASECNTGHYVKKNEGNEEGWDEKLLKDEDDKMDLEPDRDDDDDVFLFQC